MGYGRVTKNVQFNRAVPVRWKLYLSPQIVGKQMFMVSVSAGPGRWVNKPSGHHCKPVQLSVHYLAFFMDLTTLNCLHANKSWCPRRVPSLPLPFTCSSAEFAGIVRGWHLFTDTGNDCSIPIIPRHYSGIISRSSPLRDNDQSWPSA